MVTCRRCGKQGWRYQMEIVDGRWYCEQCYAIVEKGEVPWSLESDRELREFFEQKRAHLEFARYLIKKGVLNEGLEDGEMCAASASDQSDGFRP